jgi:Uma2 family endonuclease
MTRMIFRPVVKGRVQVEPLTVDEYHRMIESGELPEDTSIELIRGFLTPKNRAATGEDPMTIGLQHALSVQKIMRFAPRIESLAHFLQIQQPVALPPDGEPEPDASIVVGKAEDYRDRRPRAVDVSCIIEVADSSLAYDRSIKRQMYADAGIAHYIIVNLIDRTVEDYALMAGRTDYQEPLILGPADILKLRLRDQLLEISLSELLP